MAQVHVQAEDVVEHTQCHEGIHRGLEFEQNVKVDHCVLPRHFVNQIAFRFFVMLCDKTLVDLFGAREIDLLHPLLLDKGLDQLTEEGSVGKEPLVAAIM